MVSQTNPWTDLHHGTPEMEAALAGCPQGIREAMDTYDPNLCGTASKLLGRDQMLNQIKVRVRQVTDAKEGTESIKATALVAPPGAGKTAVLRDLEEQLREDGVNVIQLTADQLILPQVFSDAMRDSPPWNRRDGLASSSWRTPSGARCTRCWKTRPTRPTSRTRWWRRWFGCGLRTATG